MKIKKEILRSAVTDKIYKMREYDENGNLIYFKDNFADKNYEEWREYDENGNLIRLIDSNGNEVINKYDENGIKILDDVYEYEFYPEEIEDDEEDERERFSLKKLFSNSIGISACACCAALGSIITAISIFILLYK